LKGITLNESQIHVSHPRNIETYEQIEQ